MRAITIAFTGIFLTTALAVSAMPLKTPKSESNTVVVQQTKNEKKKPEPFKPQEKTGY